MIMLIILSSSLRLDAESLRIRHGWRTQRTQWKDTGVFEVARIGPADVLMVVYDDAAGRNSRLGAINTSLIGRTGGLPDSYGLSYEELAWLLNQWRERALSGHRL